MTTTLSDSEATELKAAFKQFDKNGDGQIDIVELGTVMRSLGQRPTESELREIIRAVDINGNGKVDFNEFIEIMSVKTAATDPLDAEQELRDAFRVFDQDANGYISPSELRAVLEGTGGRFSDGEIEEMIREADHNGDGRIDYNEFVELMRNPKRKNTDSSNR